MATMIAGSSSLNPQAAEYFPSNYYNRQFYSFVNHYGCPVFPSLIYYSATVQPPSSLYLLPQQNHEVLISRAMLTNPNPCAAVSDQSHLVVEPAAGVVITDDVGSPSSAHANRGVRGGRHGNWKGRGVVFNGREGGHSKGQGHDNPNFKKQWNARSDYDGKKSKNIQKFGGRRHSSVARSCKPNNRQVVPVHPDGQNTTVMIRNIPNRYTREMLMEFLDNHCMLENQKAKLKNEKIVSAFDFLYLPIDFENQANKGYAFVNFTNPAAAWKFHLAVHDRRWDLFQSLKKCEIAGARLQGKEELVKHFKSSVFDCETDDYLPVCFSPPRNGSRVMVRQKLIGRRIGTNQKF